MSNERRDKDYLSDILEAMHRVVSYVEGMSYEGFMQDTRTQDAVVRNIEIIGEAAKHLTSSLKQRLPEIPWREISGMRDKLIHHYFGINYDVVWIVATKEIPQLMPRLAEVFDSLTGDQPPLR